MGITISLVLFSTLKQQSLIIQIPTNIKPCKLKLEYNSYTEYKLSIFHVLLKLMRFHPAKRETKP